MSGPLIYCTSCTRELTKARIIVNSLKEEKLSSEEVNVLLASDQDKLLNNSVAKVYEDLKLNLCCRMCMSNVDYTPDIYG